MPTRRWVRSSLGVQGKRFITYPKGGSFPSLLPGGSLFGRDVSPFGDLAIVRWRGSIARWFAGRTLGLLGFWVCCRGCLVIDSLCTWPMTSQGLSMRIGSSDTERASCYDAKCASLNFPQRRRGSLSYKFGIVQV